MITSGFFDASLVLLAQQKGKQEPTFGEKLVQTSLYSCMSLKKARVFLRLFLEPHSPFRLLHSLLRHLFRPLPYSGLIRRRAKAQAPPPVSYRNMQQADRDANEKGNERERKKERQRERDKGNGEALA